MAANPDIVEKVGRKSSDAHPPTRRKVMRAIRASNCRQGNRTTTDEQDAEITARAKAGESQGSLALEFGIAKSSVSEIARGYRTRSKLNSEARRIEVERIILQKGVTDPREISKIVVAPTSSIRDDIEALGLAETVRAAEILEGCRTQLEGISEALRQIDPDRLRLTETKAKELLKTYDRAGRIINSTRRAIKNAR